MRNETRIYLKKTRTGHKTAEINGITLHSAYNPAREARRFIDNTLNRKVPGTIILAGAGLGYIQQELISRFPGVKLLPVYYSTELYQISEQAGNPAWHPQSDTSLITFLRHHLSELDLGSLKILTWPVSTRIFPALAGSVEKQISHLLKELGGSFLTSYTMGKLWLSNSFRNFIYQDRVFSFQPTGTGKPVIIAGSGPSLEDAVGKIKDYRQKISLWALPSAVLCLQAYDLDPDLVVLTDPGFYSLYHLGGLKKKHSRILMPLSAAAGTWQADPDIAYIRQPNFFEHILLDLLKLPAPDVSPCGTVAATALELALCYTKEPVITTGLDFCCRDIQSHALPNAFHKLLDSSACRTDPTYSRVYRRARASTPFLDRENKTRTSRPLLTYGGWFNNLLPGKKNRVSKLENKFRAGFHTRTFSTGDLKDLPTKATGANQPLFKTTACLPGRSQRQQQAVMLLDRWRSDINKVTGTTTGADGFPDNFFCGGLLFDLCYFTDLDKLNKARTAYKSGDNAGTRRLLDDLLKTSAAFLDELKQKIGSGD